jgi:hypothetical protein
MKLLLLMLRNGFAIFKERCIITYTSDILLHSLGLLTDKTKGLEESRS